MQEMKGWERVFTLVLASFFVILIPFKIMEVNPMVWRYTLLVGYLALGVWLAVRQGRQKGMVRERIRPLSLFAWFIGLFVVFGIVTPW